METIRALVLSDYGTAPTVETVDLADPGPGQVRVKLEASGVCHSDWHAVTATLPLPVPLVLGHEGSGTVEEVGPGVTRVKPGDRVVVSWIAACGECYWCRRDQPELCEEANRGAVNGLWQGKAPTHRWRGEPLYTFSLAGTLAEATVVPESSVTPVPRHMPWEEAALLGCAVLTGTGAAFRSPIQPGDRVAVIGAGGVGQNVIQGARIMGAEQIIAVDPVGWKRTLAREFGATDEVDPESQDALDQILELTDGRGADVTFEVVGRPDLMALAFNAARRGGTAVAVGVPAPHEELTVNAFAFPSQEKTLTGSWSGGAYPPRDLPRLLSLWDRGELLLNPLITSLYRLEEAPQAFSDLLEGRTLRGVVRLGRHGQAQAARPATDLASVKGGH
jgi:S-(hydroxymethyl)glutathione dehydrogenase/alcohol dehydrogenase